MAQSKVPIPRIWHEKPPEIRVWMKPDSANGDSCGRPVIGCDSQQQNPAPSSEYKQRKHGTRRKKRLYYYREVWVYLTDPVCGVSDNGGNFIAPRAREASEAKRAQRTGGGYQENGHASSVVDNIGCKTSSVILASLNTFETKTMVYVTI